MPCLNRTLHSIPPAAQAQGHVRNSNTTQAPLGTCRGGQWSTYKTSTMSSACSCRLSFPSSTSKTSNDFSKALIVSRAQTRFATAFQVSSPWRDAAWTNAANPSVSITTSVMAVVSRCWGPRRDAAVPPTSATPGVLQVSKGRAPQTSSAAEATLANAPTARQDHRVPFPPREEWWHLTHHTAFVPRTCALVGRVIWSVLGSASHRITERRARRGFFSTSFGHSLSVAVIIWFFCGSTLVFAWRSSASLPEQQLQRSSNKKCRTMIAAWGILALSFH